MTEQDIYCISQFSIQETSSLLPKKFYQMADDIAKIEHEIAVADPTELKREVLDLLLDGYHQFANPHLDETFDETLRQVRERDSRRMHEF